MPRKNTTNQNQSVTDYRHSEKRKNIPPAGLASQGKINEVPKTRYSYDPHLPPVLRFDPTGDADQFPELLQIARQRALTHEEASLISEALRNQRPWLEWSGKRERDWFEVDPVALHIHERVSAQAILKLAQRAPMQRSLFADPELEYRQAIQFYEHDVDWANRLILGDSLTVMNSLAKREDLAGKVQMIYFDPPYGINYRNNFQSQIGKRDVKEKEEDLTRQQEMVKAFRDTWTLGVHSYLSYLRDRLYVAKELLADSGSIFVQISDENVHKVRTLLDEIFGVQNFVAQINYRSMTPLRQSGMAQVYDYVLWYARNKDLMDFYPIYERANITEDSEYSYLAAPGGNANKISVEEKKSLPTQKAIFKRSVLTSSGYTPSCTFRFEFQGNTYTPLSGKSWRTNPIGMQRLIKAERLFLLGRNVYFRQYHGDFGHQQLENSWHDTAAGFSDTKIYVVQTNEKIIQRCLLMTTKPGDLVIDPTCGSGTTAYLAEMWGRRWITVDTSRVAIALTRQRILTAKFDFYKLKDGKSITNGLSYNHVPKIELGRDIAQNPALDPIFLKYESLIAEKLQVLNIALKSVSSNVRTKLLSKLNQKLVQGGKKSITEGERRKWVLPSVEWREWEVPFEKDDDWPSELCRAYDEYYACWKNKIDEINTTISAGAPQEDLFDQPIKIDDILRVSGPFTVEGIQPIEETLDLESSIGDKPDDLETFTENDIPNVEAYLEKMLRLLKGDGVRFPDNKVVKFTRLESISNNILHAEGEWGNPGRKVAISFGPQYGPITAKQVEECLHIAARRGYEDLVLAGFNIDGAAQAIIQDDPNPMVHCHMAHIRPDVNMGDLLKDTPGSQLFTVFGLPRVRLEPAKDGEWVAVMEGVDIYDPVNNTIQATHADKVAAWFFDSDYDGRTFCITQAFFPDSSAWEKIATALKSSVDPERFAAFSGTRSLPFSIGVNKRAAVKVIDPRGNEAIRVLSLGD